MSEFVERRIVSLLCSRLRQAGWRPTHVDTGDDSEPYVPVKTVKDVLTEVFSVDTCTVTFRNAERTHGVLLVCGNGADLITDYSYSVNDLDGFDREMGTIIALVEEKYQ